MRSMKTAAFLMVLFRSTPLHAAQEVTCPTTCPLYIRDEDPACYTDVNQRYHLIDYQLFGGTELESICQACFGTHGASYQPTGNSTSSIIDLHTQTSVSWDRWWLGLNSSNPQNPSIISSWSFADGSPVGADRTYLPWLVNHPRSLADYTCASVQSDTRAIVGRLCTWRSLVLCNSKTWESTNLNPGTTTNTPTTTTSSPGTTSTSSATTTTSPPQSSTTSQSTTQSSATSTSRSTTTTVTNTTKQRTTKQGATTKAGNKQPTSANNGQTSGSSSTTSSNQGNQPGGSGLGANKSGGNLSSSNGNAGVVAGVVVGIVCCCLVVGVLFFFRERLLGNKDWKRVMFLEKTNTSDGKMMEIPPTSPSVRNGNELNSSKQDAKAHPLPPPPPPPAEMEPQKSHGFLSGLQNQVAIGDVLMDVVVEDAAAGGVNEPEVAVPAEGGHTGGAPDDHSGYVETAGAGGFGEAGGEAYVPTDGYEDLEMGEEIPPPAAFGAPVEYDYGAPGASPRGGGWHGNAGEGNDDLDTGFQDLPMEEWTRQHVGDWFSRVGRDSVWGHYGIVMQQNKIDGATLAHLTNEDFKEMGVARVHMGALINAVNNQKNAVIEG